MKRTPVLVDCVALHTASPTTFEIPSDQRKRRLRVGDSVQIVVGSPYPDAILLGERIWLKMTAIIDGVITGTVESFPVYPEDIEVDFRDTLSFEAKHILAILTIEEKAATNAEIIESLQPLDRLVELPEDPDDDVEMDEEEFGKLLLSTIPVDLIVSIIDDDLPTVWLNRRGGRIEVLVVAAFDPQKWERPFDIRSFCDAMITIAEALITDGHPLANPHLADEAGLQVLWEVKFPVTTRPDLLLMEIEHYCERIDSSAEQLLLGDD
jgi:hypothetical protein